MESHIRVELFKGHWTVMADGQAIISFGTYKEALAAAKAAAELARAFPRSTGEALLSVLS